MSYRRLFACLMLGPALAAQTQAVNTAIQPAAGGLAIPRPSTSTKVVPAPVHTARRAMPKLDPQQAAAYFAAAAQAFNIPVVKPNPAAAFTLCPRQPEVPGRGYILSMFGAHYVMPTVNGNGTADFIQPGDDNHFVQIALSVAKGLHLVRSDSLGSGGTYTAWIQVGGHQFTVSGPTDANGIFSFPFYAPAAGNVYISFQSPKQFWVWNGCEIIPQQ